MDAIFLKVPATALVVPTLVVAGIAYAVHRFNTRISPTIPYAGEESLAARLRVPVEYGKDPVEFLRKTRKQLGDVFCVDLFAAKIVFVLGAEGNKAVMRAAEDKLSFFEQIKWALGPTIDYLFDVPGWTPLSMKLVKIALMKQEHLDGYKVECSKLTDEFFEKWANQGIVPLFQNFSYLIIAYMLVILNGPDFYRNYGEELVPMMAQFERDLQHPILRVLPRSLWGVSKPGKALFSTCDRFDALISLELRDILDNPEKHKDRNDYFYFLVSQAGDTFAQCYGRHIMSLVFGGHANAAMTIPWLFLHARRTPGALARIRTEALLPPDARRPFLDACFRETGRLYTNTSVMRMTRGATDVAGHAVPARTLVAASPLATQRADVSGGGVFAGAGCWDPERFLADPGAYAGWFQRAEFVQFGLGIHACPGEKLARMLIFDLVLRTWMEKYDIEVVSGLEEGVKGLDGVGAEGAWTEENFGTPSVRGEDVIISVKESATAVF
ncbi:cytochrome P450 [Phellopilus nigrolimitatus]|nr:cytochrome P450 [Phellopilus nigrolimitatus]